MAKNTSNKQYSNKAFRPALGQKNRAAIDDEKTPYADPSRKKESYETLHTTAEKFAPNKDKPTTAAGKKGSLDLPAVLAAVDPKGISSVAPMMYQMLGQIQSSSAGSSQSSRKGIIEEALTGALFILSNKYTFNKVTRVFDTALKDGKISLLDAEYRPIVKNALANLYKNYITYKDKIPTTVYERVTVIGTAPSPVVTDVPDFYVQTYYTKETDPYPGYKVWVSPNKSTKVFTKRELGQRYYVSASEEIYGIAESQITAALDPLISSEKLTVQDLNEILDAQDQNVESNTQNKNGGNNTAQNLTSTLMQLAGYAGTIANLQKSIHLPKSVLNKDSINKSHQAFMKNIGQLKQEKEKAKQAAQPMTAVASLLSTAGVATSVASMASSAKNLYNTIKS